MTDETNPKPPKAAPLTRNDAIAWHFLTALNEAAPRLEATLDLLEDTQRALGAALDRAADLADDVHRLSLSQAQAPQTTGALPEFDAKEKLLIENRRKLFTRLAEVPPTQDVALFVTEGTRCEIGILRDGRLSLEISEEARLYLTMMPPLARKIGVALIEAARPGYADAMMNAHGTGQESAMRDACKFIMEAAEAWESAGGGGVFGETDSALEKSAALEEVAHDLAAHFGIDMTTSATPNGDPK